MRHAPVAPAPRRGRWPGPIHDGGRSLASRTRPSAPRAVAQKPRPTTQTNAAPARMAAAPRHDGGHEPPATQPRADPEKPRQDQGQAEEDEDGLRDRLSDLGNAHGCPPDAPRHHVLAQETNAEQLSADGRRGREVVDPVTRESSRQQPAHADHPLATRERQGPSAGIEEDAQAFDQQDGGQAPSDEPQVPSEAVDSDGRHRANEHRRAEDDADQLDAVAPERGHWEAASGRCPGTASTPYATTIPANAHAPTAAA